MSNVDDQKPPPSPTFEDVVKNVFGSDSDSDSDSD